MTLDLIRFYPLEITSLVWFMDGDRECTSIEIQSIVLIPRGCFGQPMISDVPFPEIFLQ